MEHIEKSSEAVRLHRCLIKIVAEIKRICEKHDIKYFLIAGSLLGAIRHQGIIPWDDDLDLGMLRADYNRFLEACKTDLGDEFIVCNPESEKGYGVPFTKVRLKNTSFVDRGVPTSIHNGIFVDIFPLDAMPTVISNREKQRKHIHLWRNVLGAKCNYGDRSFKIFARKILLLPFEFLPKKYILKKLDQWQTKYNHLPCENYISFTSAYAYGRDLYPAKSVEGVLELAPFEDILLPILHHSDEYLTHLYGDYMKFPPEKDRVFKHADTEINFGPY